MMRIKKSLADQALGRGENSLSLNGAHFISANLIASALSRLILKY